MWVISTASQRKTKVEQGGNFGPFCYILEYSHIEITDNYG